MFGSQMTVIRSIVGVNQTNVTQGLYFNKPLAATNYLISSDLFGKEALPRSKALLCNSGRNRWFEPIACLTPLKSPGEKFAKPLMAVWGC